MTGEASYPVSTGADMLQGVRFSIMPVRADLPPATVNRRLDRFSALPNNNAGLVGSRWATVDEQSATTELVYAIAASSHNGKTCACCLDPIRRQMEHVLLSPPPVNRYPYHHVHRPCFDVVLAGLVEVRRTSRDEARKGVLRHTELAAKFGRTALVLPPTPAYDKIPLVR